jgi:hypothetical protein
MIKSAYFKTNSSSGGFTLLFAVLTSSLLMVVGISIFNIALKQTQLTFAARDSQSAFYASDVGIECALFWDLDPNGSAFDPDNPTPRTINCLSQDSPSFSGSGSPQEFLFTFSNADFCIELRITKDNTIPSTVMEASGFAMAPCDASASVRTERAIRVSY